MRIKTPDFGSKKELFDYLVKNKTELIAQKKSMPIFGDVISSQLELNVKGASFKANEGLDEAVDVIRVKVVANTANWIDSHMDMLLPDSAKKSISERKNIIPHLHDHIHTVDAKVGEVVDIKLENVSYEQLGLSGSGMTQAIIFITDIMKSYNEKVFNQYKVGKVNQHSIGLQYVKLDLAINDKDYKEEYAVWEKYIEKAINPEVAEKHGFFWTVKEIKLIENSAVLFGANELTPTLDNNVKNEPVIATHETNIEPSQDTQSKLNYLLF